MKYIIHKEIQRFTVFTQDAINTNEDKRKQGSPNILGFLNRRKFVFKLPLQSHLKSSRCKIAIEAIYSVDNDARQIEDVGGAENIVDHNSFVTQGETQEKLLYNNMIINYKVNSSKYELYSIRSPNIHSSSVCDTRPQEYQSGPIIYTGKLDFQNFNPKECFIYDCGNNVINDYFTLYIDNNYFEAADHEKGIKDDVEVSVSFIIYDVDEIDYEPLSNAPNINLKNDLILNRGYN